MHLLGKAYWAPGGPSDLLGRLVAGGSPGRAVKKLADEVQRIVRATDVGEKMRAMGVEPIGSTPEEAERFVRAETVKWAEVVRVSGAKPN